MFKKKLPKKITKIVQNYTQRLESKEKLPIEKVIVFGSQAKRKTHKWSDIDVCIISPKFKNSFNAIYYLLTKLEKQEVLAGIELVGYTKENFQEGSSFIEEIKKTGVILK